MLNGRATVHRPGEVPQCSSVMLERGHSAASKASSQWTEEQRQANCKFPWCMRRCVPVRCTPQRSKWRLLTGLQQHSRCGETLLVSSVHSSANHARPHSSLMGTGRRQLDRMNLQSPASLQQYPEPRTADEARLNGSSICLGPRFHDTTLRGTLPAYLNSCHASQDPTQEPQQAS